MNHKRVTHSLRKISLTKFEIILWNLIMRYALLFLFDKIHKIIIIMLEEDLNDTNSENCVLLNSVQEFIEIEAWLLLIFFQCLHNQFISIHSIVTY